MTFEEMRELQKRANKAENLTCQMVALRSAITKIETYLKEVKNGCGKQYEFKESNSIIVSSMNNLLGDSLDGVEISCEMRKEVTKSILSVLEGELGRVEKEFEML